MPDHSDDKPALRSLMTLLGELESRLLDAVDEEGEQISRSLVADTCASFRADLVRLDACVDQIQSEAGVGYARRFEDERSDLLGRILIGKFEHLLEGPERADGVISRRLIPAFLRAIYMMVGAGLLEESHDALDEIHEEIAGDGRAQDNPVLWKKFVEHPTSRSVVQQVVFSFISQFGNYPRRKQWLIDWLNRNLEEFENPIENEQLEPAWQLDDTIFILMLRAFVRDLILIYQSPEGVVELTEHYDSRDVESVRVILGHVSSDF